MLHVAQVPVITLAVLVVVTNAANACRTVVEPILVAMRARRQRFSKLPDHDLNNRAIVADFLGVRKEDGPAYIAC